MMLTRVSIQLLLYERKAYHFFSRTLNILPKQLFKYIYTLQKFPFPVDEKC